MTAREFKAFLEEVERGPLAAAMDEEIQMTCNIMYGAGPLSEVEVTEVGGKLKIFIWDREG